MTRIRFFILLIILSFSIISFSQVPNWAWAKSAGGNGCEISYGIATDKEGNVYITGYFGSSTITFGTITLTNEAQTYEDIFVAKYDNAGNILWAKREGSNVNDDGFDIATDINNNVYVVGAYTSPVLIIGNDTLVNQGYADVVFFKYSPSGNTIWAKSIGGTYYDDGFCITTDLNGNVYIAGYFSSPSISFDSTTLINSNPGSSEIFLIKYDSTGNVIWAKSIEGNYDDYIARIVTDNLGNIYMSGEYTGSSIIFGSDTLINTSTGFLDIFIAKYDSTGNVLWAKREGGIKDDIGGVTVDTIGNIYITGFFSSPSIIFGNDTLINALTGTYDVFISKYDTSGNVKWAKRAGGIDDDYGGDITIDNKGNAYITGIFFSNSISFENNTLVNAGYVGYGTNDFFVVKYDSYGNALWALGAEGGTNFDDGQSIAVDTAGNIYITGDFWSSWLLFGNNALSTINSADVFTAKINYTVGIDEHSTIGENSIIVFPNPANAIIYFNDKYSFSLYSVQGELLNKGMGISMNISNLATGIYILKFENNENFVIKKFVKE